MDVHTGCIIFQYQLFWRAESVPFPSVWTCRVCPFPISMDVQGVSLSHQYGRAGCVLSIPISMDVQGVSLSIPSSMDVQGVSLSIPSSMDVQGVSLSIPSSMDVQSGFLSIPSSIDVQGVSLSIPSSMDMHSCRVCPFPFPAVWTCRVCPFPFPAVWTCRVCPFPFPAVWTCRVYPFHHRQCERAGCISSPSRAVWMCRVYVSLFRFFNFSSGTRMLRYRTEIPDAGIEANVQLFGGRQVGPRHKVHIQYTQSTTVSVPSLELGPPTPSPPWRGVHTRLRARGWGSPNSDDWRETLVFCLLCGPRYPRYQILFLYGVNNHSNH